MEAVIQFRQGGARRCGRYRQTRGLWATLLAAGARIKNVYGRRSRGCPRDRGQGRGLGMRVPTYAIGAGYRGQPRTHGASGSQAKIPVEKHDVS